MSPVTQSRFRQGEPDTARRVNDQGHRAGARSFPVQNRMIRPLRWTDLFATTRGMCPRQASGSGRSVDYEEHEGIRERSVRCHTVVPARGASEPRSHNRSFDSAERRIPSSWLLQRRPVVNALSGEQRRKEHPSRTQLHPQVPPFGPVVPNSAPTHSIKAEPPTPEAHSNHLTREHVGISERVRAGRPLPRFIKPKLFW